MGAKPTPRISWSNGPGVAHRDGTERAYRRMQRRYEIYSVYDLPRNVKAINPILDAFQHLYNHHRPPC
jgi:hypothetical protein